MEQLSLFPGAPLPQVEPAPAADDLVALARRLPSNIRLGTSSWSFPGWGGLVYRSRAAGRAYSREALARAGLAAYARHPLLGAVGLDRTFYAPIEADEFRAYAAQVPDKFRFLVKAHSACTLAREEAVHDGDRIVRRANPNFLEPGYALRAVIAPLVEGLGPAHTGADGRAIIVFQFPPQRPDDLGPPDRFAARLARFLSRLPRTVDYAVELRNPGYLGANYRAALEASGVSHCFNVWSGMPGVGEQLRRLGGFRGPELVVRWLLHPGLSYESAERRYSPFQALRDEDPGVRREIVALVRRALAEESRVTVVINNKAEGSAPLSVRRLAEALVG